MARFHSLDVVDVRRETRDAVVVTLRPRDEDAPLFGFKQGQYLTFRRRFDDDELRRSYSICAGLDDGAPPGRHQARRRRRLLDLGQRGAEARRRSSKPCRRWAASTPPSTRPPPSHYLGFAGGSGITPLLSIIKTVLAREPKSTFTLVYANRQISSIMFREELEDLKNRHLGRLSILHILETEAQDIDLFTGRVDGPKCERSSAPGSTSPRSTPPSSAAPSR